MPSWIVPLASLAAALIVGVANYAVQRWRYQVDRTAASIDHLCGELNAAADLATRYWLLDGTNKDDARSARWQEPELIGRQLRLQELVLALHDQDRRLDLRAAENLMPDLYAAMTGGSFGMKGRSGDPAAAQRVQELSARLNGCLRRAAGKRNRGWR